MTPRRRGVGDLAGSGPRPVREVSVQHVLIRCFVGVMARQQMFDVADHPLTVVTALQLHVSSIRRLGSATPGRIRCLSFLHPTADGTLVNNVTRGKMWLVEAFEVLIATVNMGAEKEKDSHDRNSQCGDNLHTSNCASTESVARQRHRVASSVRGELA